MATVSKEAAIDEAEKCAKQKQPVKYCVMLYENLDPETGDSIGMKGAYFEGMSARMQFKAMLQSDAVGVVQILWGSERFHEDHPEYIMPWGKTEDDMTEDELSAWRAEVEAIASWTSEGGAGQ